ncbi:hypothetical protein HRJ41_26035 (plasmid) [Pseudomonas sp. BF61]|uniref:hypothetical protein n=1 Tax=Pseudomonas sp. BF61 TaxID=2741068 RepID=UPI001C0DDC49|nr:hypothetical protein [Pseudomonas sp. BF61]MBU4630937.1 hypothetical protein [Pseudomonas sp. BF61]
MSEDNSAPQTARDALITELLSDVGRIHDDIKAIPKMLELSLSESLEIIAKAVGDAEATAQQLQEASAQAIQATATQLAFEAGTELTGAIQKSLERTFEPALARASAKIDALEERVKSLSGNLRDTDATRTNFVLLVGFVASVIVMLCGLAWIGVLAHSNNDTNKWFYDEYKSQRAIIETLPPEISRKFDRK